MAVKARQAAIISEPVETRPVSRTTTADVDAGQREVFASNSCSARTSAFSTNVVIAPRGTRARSSSSVARSSLNVAVVLVEPRLRAVVEEERNAAGIGRRKDRKPFDLGSLLDAAHRILT